MSWLGTTLVSLALLGPGSEAVPTRDAVAVEARAGSLVDADRTRTTVLLLAPDRAWAPGLFEGLEVCSAEGRCAPVEQVRSCEAPGCPFGFGTVYRLGHAVVELEALSTVDEDTLVALEAEPSLRPLIGQVRAHRDPASSSPEVLVAAEPEPEPMPEPMPVPAPAPAPLRVASSEPPPPEPPPPFSGWNGTVGWSFEATGTPALGVVFVADQPASFAVGGTMTLGVHHQFAMRPSRGPSSPRKAKRQRPFLVAWVGNNFGADLVLSASHARNGPSFGIAAELAARGVFNSYGDAFTKQGPSRLRVLSMIDHLVPMPGLRLDARGTPRLELRFGGPISILVRQRVGVEIRLDMGFRRFGGPSEGYVLVGVGVLARKQLGHDDAARRKRRGRRSEPRPRQRQ